MDWIYVTQDRDNYLALLNTVWSRQVPYNVGISYVAEKLLASQLGPCCMKLGVVIVQCTA